MTEPPISVLLVDDHSLVRRGFRRMLEDDTAITVVGEAEDGHTAVQLAIDLRPRVVVMDFAMPSMNGAVAARQILRAAPEIAILILSMHAETSYVRTCLEAGMMVRTYPFLCLTTTPLARHSPGTWLASAVRAEQAVCRCSNTSYGILCLFRYRCSVFAIAIAFSPLCRGCDRGLESAGRMRFANLGPRSAPAHGYGI